MKKFPLGITAALVILSTGCGGGGGGSQSPTFQSSNQSNSTNKQQELSFRLSISASGLEYRHEYVDESMDQMPVLFASGLAVGDYDNDGDNDIYFIAGDAQTNALFNNQGDGTFLEVANQAGIAITGIKGAGATFADIDGDGFLDLMLGAVQGEAYYLFQNNQDGTFTDVTETSGLVLTAKNTLSSTFGDVDGDGDIDMFLAHWGNPIIPGKSTESIWRNDSANGEIKFTDISLEMGLTSLFEQHNGEEFSDYSLTPNFTDFDNDGDQDILLASDFITSKVLRNDGSKFSYANTKSINDQAGMGASVGDFNNDGLLDWFVTSIYNKDSLNGRVSATLGYTGNRLYLNLDDGTFLEVAKQSGVEDGGWGWGSCFADFNNDGNLDIFHVNGWGQQDDALAQYKRNNAKLFIGNGDGTFTESADTMSLYTAGQGRGIACSDMDQDGDLDIIVTNNQQRLEYFVNQLNSTNRYLQIKLMGKTPNTQALGAKVTVTTGSGNSQIREQRINNHFSSHSATELHFGLGNTDQPVKIKITWPDGTITEMDDIESNQMLIIKQT